MPISEVEIRSVVSLVNRAYRGDAGSGWSTTKPYIEGDRTTEAKLRSDLARRPTAHLLTWRNDPSSEIEGCVWLEPEDIDVWHLGLLAIDPEKQNGGRGREMLSAAEDFARLRGAGRLRISVVNIREALIAWYRRRGYNETGEIEPFPYGDDPFGRPLRDDLHFVMLEKNLRHDSLAI